VNDASTDNSLVILNEYAAKDKRILVVTLHKNSGESSARNAGIDRATGQYIGFVDSDDYISHDFYDKLNSMAVKTGADIIKGNRIKIDCSGYSHNEFINDKINENKLNFTHQHTTAIYSEKMICDNKIYYPPGIINNADIVFLVKAVCFAKSVITVDDALYYYMRRNDSMSPIKYNFKQCLSVLESFCLIIDFINAAYLSSSDYITIFYTQFMHLKGLHTRVTDLSSVRACAETSLKLHAKCKYREILNAKLAEEHPAWLEFLLSNDAYGLTEFLFRNDSPGRLAAADLRARFHQKARSI
jgi:glycosyltransferase involved in cell wall biosynthesis